MRLRLPMMGHGLGPGGRFSRRRPRPNLRRERMVARRIEMYKAHVGKSIFF